MITNDISMLERLKRQAIEEGEAVTVDQAMELDRLCSTYELSQAADEIRKRWCGNEIHTCSIVNARSGKCGEDCKWCAQSARHDTGIKEYDYISRDEMMSSFEANRRLGVSCFSLVTSGRKVMPLTSFIFLPSV